MSQTIQQPEESFETSELMSALGPELPLLATRAAIELDNLLLGKESPLTNVQLLAEKLDRSTGGHEGACCFTADLPTVDVIARALVASQYQINTISEAAATAWKIAKELHSAGESGQEETATATMKRMRTFCVELARSASIFRSMLEESQPSSSQWS